jgi:hypothetical protein
MMPGAILDGYQRRARIEGCDLIIAARFWKSLCEKKEMPGIEGPCGDWKLDMDALVIYRSNLDASSSETSKQRIRKRAIEPYQENRHGFPRHAFGPAMQVQEGGGLRDGFAALEG